MWLGICLCGILFCLDPCIIQVSIAVLARADCVVRHLPLWHFVSSWSLHHTGQHRSVSMDRLCGYSFPTIRSLRMVAITRTDCEIRHLPLCHFDLSDPCISVIKGRLRSYTDFSTTRSVRMVAITRTDCEIRYLPFCFVSVLASHRSASQWCWQGQTRTPSTGLQHPSFNHCRI